MPLTGSGTACRAARWCFTFLAIMASAPAGPWPGTSYGVVSAIPGNCIAGGSGYARLFSRVRHDVISMQWNSIPTESLTVEFWTLANDPYQTWFQVLSYAVETTSTDTGDEALQDNELSVYLTQTPDVRLEVHSEAQSFGAVYNETGLHTAEPQWVHLSFVIDTLTGRDQCYVNGHFFSERNRTQFLTPLAPGGILILGQEQDGLAAGFDKSCSQDGMVDELRVRCMRPMG